MAGHSHAANVAIRKGKQDRLRGKLFSKLSKNIMIAARGGPDPDFNFALRHAVDMAKAQSRPADKIDHAIKKGAGLLEGAKIQEVMYEAYGPGGVAFLIETVTDNPNRTRPEVTHILERGGGKLASPNAVMFMFQRKGLFAVGCDKISEEKLMEIVLDAGADDMETSDDVFEVYTSIEAFEAVKKALDAAGVEANVAELKYLPDNEIEVDEEVARKIFKLIEKIEEHDDVNSVHTNLKYTGKTLAVLKEE
jgi:YebC/PmpR family DNA-binding regulatory protein